MHLVTTATDDSILRAKAQMHSERINAGFCPVCEPVRHMDEWGFCPNLFCRFAAFAQAGPLSPGLISDPRR